MSKKKLNIILKSMFVLLPIASVGSTMPFLVSCSNSNNNNDNNSNDQKPSDGNNQKPTVSTRHYPWWPNDVVPAGGMNYNGVIYCEFMQKWCECFEKWFRQYQPKEVIIGDYFYSLNIYEQVFNKVKDLNLNFSNMDMYTAALTDRETNKYISKILENNPKKWSVIDPTKSYVDVFSYGIYDTIETDKRFYVRETNQTVNEVEGDNSTAVPVYEVFSGDSIIDVIDIRFYKYLEMLEQDFPLWYPSSTLKLEKLCKIPGNEFKFRIKLAYTKEAEEYQSWYTKIITRYKEGYYRTKPQWLIEEEGQ